MWQAFLQAVIRAFAALGSVGKWVLDQGNRWVWQPCKQITADALNECGQMVHRAGTVLEWTGDKIARYMPFGGSGGGPALPKKDLGLPTADDAKFAQENARGQYKAADSIMDHPARQVKAWLNASEAERETIPLTKLSIEQQVWLAAITEDKYQVILDAPDRKIFDALRGIEDAIPGVLSYGVEPERKGPLTERVHLFRSGELERPPLHLAH